MKNGFAKKLNELNKKSKEYSVSDRIELLLTELPNYRLTPCEELIQYHDFLLFVLAHPTDKRIYQLAEKELKRISLLLKNPKLSKQDLFSDTGLPHTKMITRYSHDLLRWMQINGWKLALDSFEEDGVELNDLLKQALPSLVREETTAGLENYELLDKLGIKVSDRLSFLIREFGKLDSSPFLKDHLWYTLKPFVQIDFNKPELSRTYNRFLNKKVFFQNEILKKFDHKNLLNQSLPDPAKLKNTERTDLVSVIRKSMIQTMRETDTSTYMDVETLRYYNLERGISIAIYGMTPDRQLPIQSYIGYTLFKNGYPAAYGGSWIYGRGAKFGLNVFESFRGGESGLMMCQLLRVYIQAFNLNYIEIDAYQFGKDNMDGIKSGAYWFYYRYGFRSIDKNIDQVSKKEMHLIETKKGYRSSEKTLIALAESNIALKLGTKKSFKMADVSTRVAKMISTQFKGNSDLAILACTAEFKEKTKMYATLNHAQKQVLEEVALFAKTFSIADKKRLNVLKQMIKVKPENPYAYNKLLIELVD